MIFFLLEATRPFSLRPLLCRSSSEWGRNLPGYGGLLETESRAELSRWMSQGLSRDRARKTQLLLLTGKTETTRESLRHFSLAPVVRQWTHVWNPRKRKRIIKYLVRQFSLTISLFRLSRARRAPNYNLVTEIRKITRILKIMKDILGQI